MKDSTLVTSKKLGWMSALFLFFVSLAACGGRVPQPQAQPLPPVDDDLLNLLPASVELAVWVDVQDLRTSPLGPLFDSVSQDSEVFPALARELLQHTYEVLIGVTAGQGEGTDIFVALFKGTFDAATTAQIVAQNGKADNDVLLRALTERTFAIGTLPLLDAVSALARREGTALRGDVNFSDFRSNGETVAVRYRKGAVVPKLPSTIDMGGVIKTEDVASLDAALRIGQSLSLTANARMDSPEAAAKTAKKMNKELRGLKNNMLVVLMGVDFLLAKIAVKAEEANLLVSIELDEADMVELGKLVERIDKIRELLSNSDAPVAN